MKSAEALITAQQRLDSLRLEHAAESVDSRVLQARMTTRLACAQASQAAACARRLADGESGADELEGGELEGGEATDGTDGDLDVMFERLDAMRLTHRSERQAMRAAALREDKLRAEAEATEVAEATAAVAVAQAMMAEATGAGTQGVPTDGPSPSGLSTPSDLWPSVLDPALEAAVGAAVEEQLRSQMVAMAEEQRAEQHRAEVEAKRRTEAEARMQQAEIICAEALQQRREEEARRAEAERARAAATEDARSMRQNCAYAEHELRRTRMTLAGGLLGHLSLLDAEACSGAPVHTSHRDDTRVDARCTGVDAVIEIDPGPSAV